MRVWVWTSDVVLNEFIMLVVENGDRFLAFGFSGKVATWASLPPELTRLERGEEHDSWQRVA